MIKKFILGLTILATFYCFHPFFARGDEITDCSLKTDPETCLQNLTVKYSANITSIKSQIKLIDSEISLTSLKITQTQSSIKTLKSEINDLTITIDQLDGTLNHLSAIYIQQVAQNYKLSQRYPSWSIFVNFNFNHILEEYKYLAMTQENNQNTLITMETTRTDILKQKATKTQKQQEMQSLQSKLAVQQNDLAKQKTVKNKLLATTQNQLDSAIAQLNQLRNFSKGKGDTCLPSSPGGGDGGWFYSQRDPRWCKQFMGYSTDTIGEVGCYISSISMIWKKYGYDMTPSKYAASPDHFVGATAWGTSPEVPPGFSSQQYSGYNRGILDGALAAGHPVIVQISMKNIAGMHFVVLKSGANGSYKMNDPWFGSDLNFTDYYSTSSILSLRLITK
jgi:peptidoglycan hydrolase CwlO-like protein